MQPLSCYSVAHMTSATSCTSGEVACPCTKHATFHDALGVHGHYCQRLAAQALGKSLELCPCCLRASPPLDQGLAQPACAAHKTCKGRPQCAGAVRWKIICLHGYSQNADILRHKMGSWRKGLKSCAELEFVDAPIVITESDIPQLAEKLSDSNVELRSWCAPCAAST